MTSVKNLAIGLTTVATLGMLTVAAAAEPIGPREDLDSSNTQDRAGMHEMMQERHEERLAELEEKNPELAAEIRARMEEVQAQMEELRAAKEAGNDELVTQIKEEMKADMEAHRAERQEHREAVKDAVESGNYDAFIEALGEHVPEDMTEEKFGQIQEIHQLLADGDKDGAKALAEEYGLEGPFGGHGPGRGGHMGKGGMKMGERFGGPANAGQEDAAQDA